MKRNWRLLNALDFYNCLSDSDFDEKKKQMFVRESKNLINIIKNTQWQ